MSPPVRLSSRAWIILLVGALGFLVWINHARMQRVEFVSSLLGRAGSVDVPDSVSPTGYAHGQRQLIVPERAEGSFHWIAQTQQCSRSGSGACATWTMTMRRSVAQ